jgi:hypothetical protein
MPVRIFQFPDWEVKFITSVSSVFVGERSDVDGGGGEKGENGVSSLVRVFQWSG